ncbi:uncharacterized protein LOC131892430 [Tigriopus californicus]|uniref:uncharacterized protein LOC131892430 n=1 Tax=Tigriopus californicus TaxID=6832 RepID=UPI0027D9DC52|nr:uncharacterized protein LOC131892430 [Tigriopus californicus]
MWHAILLVLWLPRASCRGIYYERFIADFVDNQDIKILNIITANVPDLLFHLDKDLLKPYYWTVVNQTDFSVSNVARGTPLLHVVFQLDGFHHLDEWIKVGSNFDLWLVEDCHVPDHMGSLKHIAIDQSVFFFCQTKTDQITVHEAYWLKGLPGPIISEVIKWTNGSELGEFPEQYERRKDLQGAVIRTAVSNWAPYALIHTHENGTKEFSGFFADIVGSLSEIMNFTLELMEPPDGSWGHLLPDGGWSGMAEGTIFFRNPRNNYNWLAYLQPLLWQVWAVIVLLFLTMPVMIATSANLPPQDRNADEFSLIKSYIFVFGALTFGRRWSVTPFTSSTRVIFFLITISGLMIQWHWKAGIISMLTVNDIIYPFEDLAGVLNSDYKLLIYPSGNLLTYFERSNDSVIRGLWERDIEQEYEHWPETYENNGLIHLAMQDDIAFFEYFEGPVTISKAYQRCELISTQKTLLPALFTFILQKNSSFHGIFNHYLNMLKEKGMFNKMAVYYKPPPQECGGGRGTPIGVNNSVVPLSIFVSGCLSCIACLFMELFWYRISQEPQEIHTGEQPKPTESPIKKEDEDWLIKAMSGMLKIH